MLLKLFVVKDKGFCEFAKAVATRSFYEMGEWGVILSNFCGTLYFLCLLLLKNNKQHLEKINHYNLNNNCALLFLMLISFLI